MEATTKDNHSDTAAIEAAEQACRCFIALDELDKGSDGDPKCFTRAKQRIEAKLDHALQSIRSAERRTLPDLFACDKGTSE